MDTELNITAFRKESLDQLRFMSGSVAELGNNAGKLTWDNSCKAGTKWEFLKTEEDFQHFREWVKPWGGWTDKEIAAWTPEELNGLLVQWIAGDLRETGLDALDPDYENIRKRQESGNISSIIWWNDTEPKEFFFSLQH